MKKVFFAIILVSLVSPKIFAQYTKGSISIGGTLALDLGSRKDKAGSTTTDGPKTTSFTFIPSAEFFLSDKFSLGLGLGYDLTRTKTVSGTGIGTTTEISTTGSPVIYPFARFYIPMGEKVSIFAQAKLDIEPGTKKTKTTVTNSTTTESLGNFYLAAGINPGISVSLSPKISLDANFGFIGLVYQKVETSNNSSLKYTDAIFRIDPSTFTFGFRYFIK
jgi:hypothetical protein